MSTIKDIITDFSIEEQQRIKKILESELKNSTVLTAIKKKIDKVWLSIGILFLVMIFGTVLLFIFKASMVFVLLWFIICIPLGLGLCIVALVKFMRAKDKILGNLIKVISRNALRIMIFSDNKKIRELFIVYSKPQFELDGGTYLIDEKCIYSYGGYPTVFYKQNIPNPLYFDFMSEINFFNNHPDKRNVNGILGITGHRIILTYSSDTLQELLKKKFFQEFLKGKHEDLFKLIIAIIGIVALVIVFALIFKKEAPPQVIQVVASTATGG